MNKRQLAKEFGVSISTVDRWIQLDCPIEQEGGNGKAYQFDPEAVQEWRDRNISPQHDSDRQTPQQIASWALGFAEKLLYYVKNCKHCNDAIKRDAQSGKFGGKR